MLKPRLVEIDKETLDKIVNRPIKEYDIMMRRMRDKGWMGTDLIINSKLNYGLVLEVGPGPGYLGLEWLKKTKGTDLKAIEISPDMINLAEKNAKEYGLENRTDYIEGDACDIPFDDNMFDGIFTSASVHEWEKPNQILKEIYRVLKPGGKYFITDLRRDLNTLLRWFIIFSTKPKEMRPGIKLSFDSAYTASEIKTLLEKSGWKGYKVKNFFMSYIVTGEKPN